MNRKRLILALVIMFGIVAFAPGKVDVEAWVELPNGCSTEASDGWDLSHGGINEYGTFVYPKLVSTYCTTEDVTNGLEKFVFSKVGHTCEGDPLGGNSLYKNVYLSCSTATARIEDGFPPFPTPPQE